MFIKGVILVVIIAACQAAEHAYSSQSITVHHEHKEHDHKHDHHVPVVEHKHEHKEEHKQEHKVEHKYEHKQEHHHQQEHHQEHQQEHHHEHKQEHHHDHKSAFSSQHIQRHDIPAHPPKDWKPAHHGPAKYEFQYKVSDPHTHDQKYQHEARDGHHVKGVYSLHEADGSVRTVHYSADKKTGFQADVKHTTKHVEEHKHHH